MAEERAMAAERALEAERRAHKATESRAAQTAAETQVLKSQLQNIQEAHSAAEAQWEADRIAAAVATASALDESSRWEAEAARWEAEAARWEAKVRDQGEQLELLELQLEREIDNLLDEFCDTEDGYRQVVEKQRKARHRAERQTEAAETALNAVREVAEAELSKGPEYLTDEAADSALNVVREVAEGQEFLASSIRMGTLEDMSTLEQSLPAQFTPFEARRDGMHARAHTAAGTSLQLSGLELGAVPATASPKLRKLLVSDEEVAAARARVAARAGLARSGEFASISTSRVDAASAQESAGEDERDEDIDASLLNRSRLGSRVGPPRGPSTAELSVTAGRLRTLLDPVHAVTKVLEEVDASRLELARLENEHQQVNQLLRAAVSDGDRGRLQSPHLAAEEPQQPTRLSVRSHARQRSTGRGKAASRLNAGPDFATRPRLAAGRSEWSSDSDSDAVHTGAAQRQEGRGHREAHERATTGPLGDGRARQRSDPWTEYHEVASPDAAASRAAMVSSGGWQQPRLESGYRDFSLSRRMDSAATGWDVDDSGSSVRLEPELERPVGPGGATGQPKERGAAAKRRTARSMYQPPAATGHARR